MRLFARSRSSLARQVPPGALRDYLSTPPADPSTPLAAVRLLAIDLETTGLDPATDQVLSVGFVPVDGEVIQLSGATEILVRPEGEVGDSARFHGLTDDALLPGVALPEALDRVLVALAGRVLLAHHAGIEAGFLSQACERLYGVRPSFEVVDTMALQFGLLSQGYDDEPPQGSLRLWTARGQYGLPRYAAHAALTDALACAELYLAQAAELQAARPRTLKSVLKG
jgi:DNA polymerase-3 subunit epsilon